jgi:hypothetical protein
MVKTCTKCGIEKELDLFAKGNKYTSGRRGTCKKCHSNYSTQYYKLNPHKVDRRPQYKRHRLTQKNYEDLVNKFNGLCHSCNDRPATHIDHDHNCCNTRFSCGKCVRGVLCLQCNTALGLLSDNIDKIKNLLDYIS